MHAGVYAVFAETNSVLLASHYCSLTSLVRVNTETSLTALGSRLEEFAVTIVEHVRSPDITLALAALPMVLLRLPLRAIVSILNVL